MSLKSSPEIKPLFQVKKLPEQVRSAMTFLLDILVERGELYQPCAGLQNPIWIQIKADGLQRPFNSNQVAPCPYPGWGTGARLVLNLDTLEQKHFKAFLMTICNGRETPFGAAQVKLESLTLGRPKKFSFPMMLCSNYSIQAGTLYVTATISSLQRQPQSQPWNGKQMQWGHSYPTSQFGSPRLNPRDPGFNRSNPVFPQFGSRY